MRDKIFYRAKNSIGDIVTSLIILILVAIAEIYSFANFSKSAYYLENVNIFNFVFLILILVCIVNFICAIFKFKHNSLLITDEGVDVTVGFRHDLIKYKNLLEIKKIYSVTLNLTVSAKIVIKNGRSSDVIYPDIRDFDLFLAKVKEVYPPFCKLTGLLQNLTNQVILSCISTITLFFVVDTVKAIIGYFPQMNFLKEIISWGDFLMIIAFVWFLIALYFRFIFPPTRKMIAEIKEEQRNLKSFVNNIEKQF